MNCPESYQGYSFPSGLLQRKLEIQKYFKHFFIIMNVSPPLQTGTHLLRPAIANSVLHLLADMAIL